MINTNMKSYDYYVLDNNDEYGQPVAVAASDKIKMSINLASETVQESPLYSGAQYVGLTLNKDVSDKYIIQYGTDKLKVLYVNPEGRFKQVFMSRM